jgi:hypothetical protein
MDSIPVLKQGGNTVAKSSSISASNFEYKVLSAMAAFNLVPLSLKYWTKLAI